MPRVEPPGQGVGAWSWVNRDGSMAVNDMDLAGLTLVSLVSSPSLIPGLGDWGIPYSGSRFLQRIRPQLRPIRRLAWIHAEMRQAVAPDPGAEGGNQPASGLLPGKIRPLPTVTGLNSKQINHLRHTTGVAHYSQLPARCGGLIPHHVQPAAASGSPTDHGR